MSLISKVLLFVFIVCGLNLQAQTDTSSHIYSAKHLIKLRNEKKDQIRYISNGESVIFQLYSDGVKSKKKYSGKIQRIDQDVFIVNDTTIQISDISMIIGKGSKKELHFINVMLSITGGITTGAGITLLTVGESIATLVGIGTTIVGVPILVGGLTKYFTSNHLRMRKGWEIETVELGGFHYSLSSD